MNYYALTFTTNPTEAYQQDLLINALADFGFDTFEEIEGGFKAYIPEEGFYTEEVDEVLEPYAAMFPFSYEATLIPQKLERGMGKQF